jgi:hypothetical protein
VREGEFNPLFVEANFEIAEDGIAHLDEIVLFVPDAEEKL